MRLAIHLVPLVAIVAAQIQECNFKGPQEWCKLATGTEFPLECHVVGSQTWCQDYGKTSEFLRGQSTFLLNSTVSGALATSSTNVTQATTGAEEEEPNCHFHAGVEHCVGGAKSSRSCAGTQRDYNIPLRIGALFIVLVTSALAIFSPVLLTRFTRLSTSGIIFVIVKNFGAGVVISTALIHLMTHANLLFASECLGHLQYEGVVAAFVMAGIFLSFLVEYAGWRLVAHRQQKQSVSESSSTKSAPTSIKAANEEITVAAMEKGDGDPALAPNRRKLDAISVLVMEFGILFHSIFIGITCVVTPNSGFGQIFAVIIFHQMFEGLALAARIADADISFKVKMICCFGFMLITPLGMGIGIGVLNQFNGNDPTTIWTIGIFDSVSAGILLWVGLVELLAGSWLWGDMRRASGLRVFAGLVALVAGLIIMSVLGKWA